MCAGTRSFRCFPLEAFSFSGAGATYLVPIKEAEEMKYIRTAHLANRTGSNHQLFPK